MKRIVLLLAVLAVAIAAWRVLGTREGTEDGAAAVERKAADETPADLVRLRGREGASAESPEETRAPAPPPASAEAEASAEAGRFVLRGTLLGLDALRPEEARVRVLPVKGMWADRHAEPAVGAAGPDGRFTMDLTPLFSRAGDLTHVDVVVDHPACVEARVRLDVTAVRAAGRGELEARITLRPGLAIAGEVVSPDGRAVAEADVALFEMGPHGPVFQHVVPIQPLAESRTDAAGRYRLRVGGPGRYLVVAVAEARRPAARDITLTAGAQVDLAPLVLEPGVTIAGRLLYDGAPVAQAWLEATAHDDLDRVPLQVGGRQALWAAGGGLACEASATTDDDGEFSFTGLSPGAHSINAYGVTLPGIHDVSYKVLESLGGIVQAPAGGLVLEIAGSVLELRTTCGSESVGAVGLQVEAPSMSSVWETDPHGVLRLLVAPLTENTVTVTDEAYRPAHWSVTSGAAGSTMVRELDLVRAAPKPSLRVTFSGDGASDLERAWFQLVPVGEESSSAGAGTESGEPSAPRPAPVSLNPVSEPVGPGVFRVTGLAPGRFTLVARPGTDFWDESGYHLEIRREIVVPGEGEVDLELPLRTGGRLRIAARSAAGTLLEAGCVIRDAAGAAQAVTFSTHSKNVAMSQGDTLGNLSPSTVAPPLRAGTYTIELSLDGYEPRTVQAVVKENETTDVDVTLAPR